MPVVSFLKRRDENEPRDVLDIKYCTSSQMIPPGPPKKKKKLMKRHLQMPVRDKRPLSPGGRADAVYATFCSKGVYFP